MEVKLIWNANMLRQRKKKFSKAQNYVDAACLKNMTQFVPVALPYYHNAGKLRDSGKIAEPGVIVYTAPMARHDYYNKKVNHRHGGNPNATALWFETMKSKYRTTIIRGAASIVGGTPK